MFPKPATIILFGATGDLAVKKLFPSLAGLHAEGLLHPDTKIVAVTRRAWDAAAFRAFLREGFPAAADDFLSLIQHAEVDLEESTGYEALAAQTAQKRGAGSRDVIIYLSLAPRFFAPVIEKLRETGVLKKGKTKLLLEKPFGTDFASAEALNDLLSSFLSESQIYRIDHYLGKTTLQTLMRMHEETHSLAEIISHKTVESVTVAIYEQKGIDGRGASYDPVGAFRDVGQNHLLAALAVLLAEYPKKKSEKSWHDARAKVLEALLPPAETCELSRRGQYRGYENEKGVALNSETETAFEVVTGFSKGELSGIPVVIQAGKKMPYSRAFLKVVFKEIQGFPREIELEIQPTERIIIRQRDGSEETIALASPRGAYGNVFLDALRARNIHFVGAREILAAWRYADRIVACWGKVPLERYDDEKPFIPTV